MCAVSIEILFCTNDSYCTSLTTQKNKTEEMYCGKTWSLYLKSIHPYIRLVKCFTKGVWHVSSGIFHTLLCDIVVKSTPEDVHSSMWYVSSGLIHLKVILPVGKGYGKSFLKGIWIFNPRLTKRGLLQPPWRFFSRSLKNAKESYQGHTGNLF